MKGRRLWVCQTHRDNNSGRCLSCKAALDYNLYGQCCVCGEPATGYRTLGADADVEFFCDAHFQGVEVAARGEK